MYEQDRPRVEWTQDKEFEDGDYIVQVSKLPLKWPRYNISIGAKGREGGFLRFIPVRSTGQGKIEVQRCADKLAALIEKAEDYIAQQIQLAEDQNQEQRMARDQRSMSFDQGRPPPKGLKRGSREGWKDERRRREEERG